MAAFERTHDLCPNDLCFFTQMGLVLGSDLPSFVITAAFRLIPALFRRLIPPYSPLFPAAAQELRTTSPLVHALVN